jgi:hypothetical protein
VFKSGAVDPEVQGFVDFSKSETARDILSGHGAIPVSQHS